MAKAIVTCPATKTLELIDFVDTPLGALLHGCSRFRPTTALVCGRACAAGTRCALVARAEAEFDDDGGDTEIEITPTAPWIRPMR